MSGQPSHRQTQSDPSSNPALRQTRVASQGVSQSSAGFAQGQYNNKVSEEFILSATRCNTIGELAKLVPVPVQPSSRDILDGVYQASQKRGTADNQLRLWKDKLRSSDFAGVAQLNSLKAPVVQVSKEAIGPDDGGLGSMNLDPILLEAKRNALTHMILIKETEVRNLTSFVQSANIAGRLKAVWDNALATQTSAITPEHACLLRDNEAIRRVAQVAAAIGESSYDRVRLAKEKRATAKKDADVNMTDVSGQNKKQLAALVEEALKRREQSRKDRTLSGKGKGRKGPSTNKTRQQQKKKRPSGNDKKRKGSRKPPAKR